MIIKQKNLRVFHIKVEDSKVFYEYFIKNKILLKEFFLLLEGKVDVQTQNFLDEERVCYKCIDNCNLRLGSVKQELNAEPKLEEKKVKYEQQELDIAEPIIENKLKVYERPIRSGEEINENLPLVVFGRINSGAKLFCTQSVTIYGIIDGLVQCDGDFILLNGIGVHGNLIFNGEIIDRDKLKDNMLQKISIKASKVDIKEIAR